MLNSVVVLIKLAGDIIYVCCEATFFIREHYLGWPSLWIGENLHVFRLSVHYNVILKAHQFDDDNIANTGPHKMHDCNILIDPTTQYSIPTYLFEFC